MTEEIQQKLAKVYELVKRGEQGEKIAAEKALKRLMKKYNLTKEALNDLKLRKYTFKYASELDLKLFQQLMYYFLRDKDYQLYKHTLGVKEISVKLEYLDFVQIETAYGYFRPHMNKQWREHALPMLKRFRKITNKNKRRVELQKVFFNRYIDKSGIYHKDQLTKKPLEGKELDDTIRLMGIEGGKYNQQVTTGLYLE